MLVLIASLLCFSVSTESVQTGVYLTLGQATIADNSYLLIDHIGSKDELALLCITDKIDCCDASVSSNRTEIGNWYSPHGVSLSLTGGGSDIGNDSALTMMDSLYVSRGRSVVRLHRASASILSPMEQGQYYCEVPDADGVTQRANVILSDRHSITIVFSPSGWINKSIGLPLTLNCSVGFPADVLPQNSPYPTIEWSFLSTFRSTNTSSLPSDVKMADTIRINDTYISSLQFPPLCDSFAGMYNCQFGGKQGISNSATISTILIQVIINGSDAQARVGERYMLTCSINIATVNVTRYTWKKGNDVLPGEEVDTLVFPSLNLSSAGEYTCEVEVLSDTYRSSRIIYLNVPAPSSAVISSNIMNPIRPVGTDVTLTCTVTLPEAVDIDVSVMINWSGPEVSIADTSTSTSEIEHNTYVSSTTIRGFNNTLSGDYNCTATVSVESDNQYITNEVESAATNSSRITTGVYISHSGEVLLNGSVIPITELGTSIEDATSSESDENRPLICYTDKPNCCQENADEGEWYLPDGQTAFSLGSKAFRVSWGNDRTVQLTRTDDQVISPAGLFCCSIPDAENEQQTLCVHLVHFEIRHAPDDMPMIGNNYNLTCEVRGVEVDYYRWSKDDVMLSESRSILSFSPLQLHDAGQYTCRTNHAEIFVNSGLSLHISAPSAVTLGYRTPSRMIIIGSDVHLKCTVELDQIIHLSDISHLLVTVEVQLLRDGIQIYLNNNTATLESGRTFSFVTELAPYERRHSGNYSCTSTITSSSAFLIPSGPVISSTIIISNGVYLSLGGSVLTNNSNVSITQVGEGENDTLFCITDLQRCCSNGTTQSGADWYYPNASRIGLSSVGNDFYVSRGYGTLKLHHKRDASSAPTGVFRCEIPDINGINKTIAVSINEIPPNPSTTSTTATTDTILSVTGLSNTVLVTATSVGILLAVLISIIIVILGIIMRLRNQRRKYPISTPGQFSSLSRDKSIDILELKELKSRRKQGDDDEFIDQQLFVVEHERAVPVAHFDSHVERLHANRDRLFEMEYKSIPMEPLYSHSAALMPENGEKNRFINIFPYDISRVKLKEIYGKEGSDYINASYLDGYKKPMVYIAAQGPLPSTVTDFWHMIWENRLKTVVMLTRCEERKRTKCEHYWPVSINESTHFDSLFTVTLTSTLPFAEFTVRKLSLTCAAAFNSPPLEITQFHFTGWPDHGVPQNGVVLLNFIKRVRVVHPYSDPVPMLVHCSAGVGRTGTFIVLDSMLLRMEIEEDLNIYKFVNQLQNQRVQMVQTQAQYNFIHDVLNELILCGDTEILAPDLRSVVNQLKGIIDGETGFCRQFAILHQICPSYSDSDYTAALQECNFSKNRYSNNLANTLVTISSCQFGGQFDLQHYGTTAQATDNDIIRNIIKTLLHPLRKGYFPEFSTDDHFRVTLHPSAVPGSDYINASFIDSYEQKNAYIATQTPMENTVNDFWRMIWETESRTIVMLCKMVEDREELCCRYLPANEGTSEIFGKVMVKVVSQENTPELVIQHLELTEYNPRPSSVTSRNFAVAVTLFHCMQWPKHGRPQAISALLELMNNINRVQMTSGNRPITVMCSDGVGRTGTFICIHAQLERLKTEGVVDFFQSIKSARIQRAGLVSTVDQYILCHNVVADYIDGFDIYANFKDII